MRSSDDPVLIKGLNKLYLSLYLSVKSDNVCSPFFAKILLNPFAVAKLLLLNISGSKPSLINCSVFNAPPSAIKSLNVVACFLITSASFSRERITLSLFFSKGSFAVSAYSSSNLLLTSLTVSVFVSISRFASKIASACSFVNNSLAVFICSGFINFSAATNPVLTLPNVAINPASIKN